VTNSNPLLLELNGIQLDPTVGLRIFEQDGNSTAQYKRTRSGWSPLSPNQTPPNFSSLHILQASEVKSESVLALSRLLTRTQPQLQH